MPVPPSSDGSHDPRQITLGRRLRVLTPRLIELMDQALVEVGEYGVVSLVVREGRVKYIEETRSVEIGEVGAKQASHKAPATPG